ncbi:golgin subfamily A member 6-like protein 22 isoform X2 [Engraulis encrasicolus]|uniref:golgin subfamily A member 6-like protein 22 isoform X2 n=1 Tax=Engraulis encrasicolus TaxID=184585 RepID=UPI002FD65627
MEQVKKMIDQDRTLTEEEKAFMMEHVVKELSQQDKALNEYVNEMEFEEEDETVMEHVKRQLEREEICEEDKIFIMEEVKDLMKKDKAQAVQVIELCEHKTEVKEEEEPLMELNIELKDMEKAPKDNGTELTNGKEELIKENGEVDQVKSLMKIEELTAEENEFIMEQLKELVQKDNSLTNQENEFSDHKTRVEVEKSLVDKGFELEKTELNEQICDEGQEKCTGQENKFIMEPLKDLIQKEKAPTAVEPKAESKVPEQELQRLLVDKETELKDQEEKTLMEYGTDLKDIEKALEDNSNDVTKEVPTQPEKSLVEKKECMEPKVELVPVKELQDKEPEKAEEHVDYQTDIKDQEKAELTRTNKEDKLMELKTEQKDLMEEPKEQGQELIDHQDNEQRLDQEQHVEGTTEETDGQANEHERMNDTHGESETTVCETQVEDMNQIRYAVHEKLERLREELEKRQHFQDIQTKFMDILRLKMHMIAHRLDAGSENNTEMQRMEAQMADKIADLERLKKGTVPTSKGMQETPGAGTEEGHEGKIEQIESVIAGVQVEVVKEKLRMAEHTIAEQQRQICVLERTAAEFMIMYKEMQKDKEEAQRHREEQDQRILQLQTLAAHLMTKMTEMERHSNEATQRREEFENTTEATERMIEDYDLRQGEHQLAMVMLDGANILNEEDGENKEKIKTPCLDLEDMRRDIWVAGDQATPGVTLVSLDQTSLTSGGQEDPLPWFSLDTVISCSSTNAEVEKMSMELEREEQKHMEKEDNEEKVIEMEKEQTKKVEPADQRKKWTGVGLETNDQREQQGEVEIEVMEEANILSEKEERKNYKVEIKTTLEDIRRDIWVTGDQATPGVTLVSLDQASPTSGQGDTLPWFTLDTVMIWNEGTELDEETTDKGEDQGTPGVTQLSVGQDSPTSGKGDTLPWFTLDTVISWKSTNAEVEKRSMALERKEVNNVGKQEKKEKQKEQTKLHEVIEKVTKAMEAKGEQDIALAEHKNDDKMTSHCDDEKHQKIIPLTGNHQKLIQQMTRELKNDRKLMTETSTNTLLGWGDPHFFRPEDYGMDTAAEGERRVGQPESHQGKKKKKKKSVLKWLKKRLCFK